MFPTLTVLTPRERILRAAHDLFYRDGVRATGVDRVIAEAGVAKVTFYRQFASKDDLILAFLDDRHERWMAWFTSSLERYGGTLAAIVPAVAEWFSNSGYRGCAFLNSVAELGSALPAVMDLTQRHKRDMTAAVTRLMKPVSGRAQVARALALAIDGAIVHAQFQSSPAPALEALTFVLEAVERGLLDV